MDECEHEFDPQTGLCMNCGEYLADLLGDAAYDEWNEREVFGE